RGLDQLRSEAQPLVGGGEVEMIQVPFAEHYEASDPAAFDLGLEDNVARAFDETAEEGNRLSLAVPAIGQVCHSFARLDEDAGNSLRVCWVCRDKVRPNRSCFSAFAAGH